METIGTIGGYFSTMSAPRIPLNNGESNGKEMENEKETAIYRVM